MPMRIERTPKEISVKQIKRRDPLLLPILLLVISFTVYLLSCILKIPIGQDMLAEQVTNTLSHSGVSSKITAVLLNFRGYDTLLEVMVLLLAVIAIWSLNRAPFPQHIIPANPVQLSLLHLLLPIMVLMASYLVWQGSHGTGGAFQGGAVLGGIGVLLLVTDLPFLRSIPSLPLRTGLLAGPVIFLTIALWCLKNGSLLQYPVKHAPTLILLIETTCAISIGITIASLFAGGRPKNHLKKPNHKKQ